jgi:threonine/homoserine/homoserine lactone efflux protein
MFSLPSLLPFVLFAFIASITPGPTNILVLSNSARFGLKAAVPIILGACGGAAVLVLVVGTGLGESLDRLPRVQALMQWVGVAWLSYLAWQIYRAPPLALDPDSNAPRLGLLGAAALQVINPKTWVMALAVVSVFARDGLAVWVLALVFLLISLPCLATWAALGIGSARLLRSPQAQQRLNRGLALVLLVSAWLSL